MTRYEPAIDLASITAIDTHVHIEVDDAGHGALPADLQAAMDRYFGGHAPMPLDAVADYYRERAMAAVVFTVDARTRLGTVPNSSEEIAEGAARNNDVLIPFGSVDPLTGAAAIESARRLHGDFGVRGFKFHPSVQGFDPSESRFSPLWAAIQEFGVPIVVHTGQTGVGAGTPGGFGLRLQYSNPMLLDTVAADFPDLRIIMAHPSTPWQDEAISIATHKANAFIDLSGWSPKYFAPQLVRNINSVLRDKVMFGSDFTAITPDRWLRDFADLELSDDVRPKVLKGNASALLGLA
ncbi:amidohydrolase family protein [Agromyces bauzanensis]